MLSHSWISTTITNYENYIQLLNAETQHIYYQQKLILNLLLSYIALDINLLFTMLYLHCDVNFLMIFYLVHFFYTFHHAKKHLSLSIKRYILGFKEIKHKFYPNLCKIILAIIIIVVFDIPNSFMYKNTYSI